MRSIIIYCISNKYRNYILKYIKLYKECGYIFSETFLSNLKLLEIEKLHKINIENIKNIEKSYKTKKTYKK
jgi:hypothetical protein